MANKGEWSELYTAKKLLADGKLYLAGEDYHKNPDEWMQVLSIQRIEGNNRIVSYNINSDEDRIDIEVDSTLNKSMKISRFKHIAKLFKNEIIEGSSSFDVSESTKAFLSEAEFNSSRARSSDKNDIYLTLKDPRTSIIRKNVGFSIKSELGKPPTIFNTATASGVKYRISDMTDCLMSETNSLVNLSGDSAVSERCRYLLENGCSFEYVGFANARRVKQPTFAENLDTINPRLSTVIEKILWNHFVEGEKNKDIDKLTDIIIEQNPCKITYPEIKYPTMIKNFLYVCYSGMTASKIWKGEAQVKGGFINVNNAGEITAQYAIESDSFKNFLFYNCFFDYPSTSKKYGDYGHVYKEGNDYFFNLNFQIKISIKSF